MEIAGINRALSLDFRGILFVFFAHVLITWLASWRWILIHRSFSEQKERLAKFFLISWLSQFAGLIFFGVIGGGCRTYLEPYQNCKHNVCLRIEIGCMGPIAELGCIDFCHCSPQ